MITHGRNLSVPVTKTGTAFTETLDWPECNLKIKVYKDAMLIS